MRVHDSTDSKYDATDKSNFTKFASKRAATVPTKTTNMPKTMKTSLGNIVTFNDRKENKIENLDENRNAQSGKCENENATLQRQRKSLPVYRLRKRLLEEIRKHETVIAIGETGSGKTTQIPQLLLHNGFVTNSGSVGITQPRRVAAVSVARRVAREQGCQLGELVGYRVRFEDATSERTRIKYLTDGTLVREAMLDETLSDYSVLILDEVHERSVRTDVLLGVARRAQSLRRSERRGDVGPLKLVVMSATMDVDKFIEYFRAPAIYLEGRQYPVRILNSTESHDDYASAALATAFKIHGESPPDEDILVFLTGQEEIEASATAARRAAERAAALNNGRPRLSVLPLYSALPTRRQLQALEPSPRGTRKLILSTNVAETSVTIEGIRHVIDTGFAKVRTHDPVTGLDVLRVERIAKAQAWQRSGRAGREAAGNCYRTYTKEEFERMREMPVPEIKRCCLAGVVLQLLAIGIDATTFDFMDKPPKESLHAAVARLEKLGAVEAKGTPRLTTLGRTMSQFPLDPRFTRVLLAAAERECLEEALTVVALLSGESIFAESATNRERAYAARARFASPDGDHATLLNVYRAYERAGNRKRAWCNENHFHHRNLEYGAEVRSQLARLAARAELRSSSCGNDTEPLRRSLLDGLMENVAELRKDGGYVTLNSRQSVAIHPSSTLLHTSSSLASSSSSSSSSSSKPRFILFTEIVATGRCYVRGVSAIEASWLSPANGTMGRC